MGYFKKFIFILILPLLAFTSAHKFYVSVTEINYSEQDKSFQIISRIFIDDLDEILEERYGINPELATKSELENSNHYIEKYLMHAFKLQVNGETMAFEYIGREYDNDVIKCYMEIENVDLKTVKSIEIENKVLFDAYEEQQNIVHFKIKNERKSFILIKENDKGLLNL